jgi:ankyrin repeat protein
MLKKIFPVMITCIFLIFGQTCCKKHELTLQEKNLFEQLNSGNIAEIARLIKEGVNIKIKDHHGNTPLHIVASRGDCESIKLLLKKGAKVNSTDDNSDTPLHEASDNGRLEVAKLLIENGANVNAKNKQGKTPIYPVAKSGNLDLVKLLVSKGAKIQTTGYTPLHDAVNNSFLQLQSDNNLAEMIEYFLSKGVDINAKDDYMVTPLYLAAGCDNSEIIDLLIKKGALVDVRTKSGETPLFRAAMAGNKVAAEVLLNKGANVNARNDANETPLHFAVRVNNMATFSSIESRVGLIKLFLDHGADVNAFDKRQCTPFYYAVGWGWFKYRPSNPPEYKNAHKVMIEAFLEKGADPNIKDRSGRTVLKLAEGEPEIVEVLIKYGAKKDN